VPRIPKLTTDNKYPDVIVSRAVDDGVREVLERMNAANFVGWSPDAWVPDEQIGNALELP
jgi:hypothetical protein